MKTDNINSIVVEHHEFHCTAWRNAEGWRIGYLVEYANHGGDPAMAEQDARSKVAVTDSWEE